MENESQYEKIERFLQKEMNKEEEQSFQEDLRQNDVLAKEVQLHQEVMESLKDEEVHVLRGALKEVNANWSAPQQKRRGKVIGLNTKRILQIAAVLGIGIVAFIYLLNPRPASGEALFAQNFTPYQMVMDERSVDVNQKQDLTSALNYYKDEKFAEAATAFELLASEQAEVSIFQFYTGMSHLASGNASSGIHYFEQIIQKKDPLFAQQSQWYIALAYLQQGQKDKSRVYLEQIDKGAYKYQQAQELLEEL